MVPSIILGPLSSGLCYPRVLLLQISVGSWTRHARCDRFLVLLETGQTYCLLLLFLFSS